jgi:spermidine/putrescine transport system ATP-binding protein
MGTPILRFENVTKRYGDNVVLDNVSLSINAGEVFSLLGPSGCGKTTLLRICGGFERPDAGRVYLDGVDITQLPPEERDVRTVFQSYALFPHMTVWENVAFGLRATGVPREEIAERVPRYLDLVQLNGFAERRPGQLSGGQRQRVAIARALVNQPKVLLLDEPLAALDLKLRQRMLMDLDAIHDEVGISFLFVTHDQQEAMCISDKIAVLSRGHVEQIGRPQELYEAPRSSFVAAFIGDTNFFEGVVTKVQGDYCTVKMRDELNLYLYNDRHLTVDTPVSVSIRPEKFTISLTPPTDTDKGLNVLQGEVEEVVYLGAHTRFWVRSGNHRISVIKQHHAYGLDERSITWGDKVWLTVGADKGYMLDRNGSSGVS